MYVCMYVSMYVWVASMYISTVTLYKTLSKYYTRV